MHWLHRNQTETEPPLATYFDTMWFGDANFPLSEDVFSALLTGGANHVFVMPTTLRKEQVAPAHPFAQYDPHLGRSNAHWRQVDPTQAALQVVAERAKWEFSSPWVFCNEISYSQWHPAQNEDYRSWTIAYARTLAGSGLTPAVYSPIASPRFGRNDWSALADAGYVAVEGYVDAPSIHGARDPMGYCASRYAAMRSGYEAQGVPVDRCVLVEHYAQTPAGTGWGRGGLALDDWLAVIPARIAGARAAGFALLGSYAWGYNRMGVDDGEIVATAQAYVAASAEPDV